MTIYQSSENFNLKECMNIREKNEKLCNNGEISMGLRTYVGLDLSKALR